MSSIIWRINPYSVVLQTRRDVENTAAGNAIRPGASTGVTLLSNVIMSLPALAAGFTLIELSASPPPLVT